MKGLELSEQYYKTYGEPMLLKEFPEVLSKLSIGLFGQGSEVLSYDDAISQDHDFEPGFLILLPGEEEVDRRTAFLLERAYAKLPKTFMGFTRSLLSPVGGNRHGVLRMSEFLTRTVGTPDGVLSDLDRLRIPEQYLLEATNGKVFRDDQGTFTAVRENLRKTPEDVKLKKLAGALLLLYQAGPYNYARCLSHGEEAAAQLALFRFTEQALHILYLLNDTLMPYYKWSFRGLSDLLDVPEGMREGLEYLILTGNEIWNEGEKKRLLETITAQIGHMLEERGLLKESRTMAGGKIGDPRETALLSEQKNALFREGNGAVTFDAEKAAYLLNDRIRDPEIRNLHILYGAE